MINWQLIVHWLMSKKLCSLYLKHDDSETLQMFFFCCWNPYQLELHVILYLELHQLWYNVTKRCISVCREQQSGPPEYAQSAAGCGGFETGGVFSQGADGSGQRGHQEVWAGHCAVYAGGHKSLLHIWIYIACKTKIIWGYVSEIISLKMSTIIVKACRIFLCHVFFIAWFHSPGPGGDRSSEEPHAGGSWSSAGGRQMEHAECRHRGDLQNTGIMKDSATGAHFLRFCLACCLVIMYLCHSPWPTSI